MSGEPSRKRQRTSRDASADAAGAAGATKADATTKRLVYVSVLQSQSSNLKDAPPDTIVLDADRDDMADLRKQLVGRLDLIYQGKSLDGRGSLEAAGLTPNDAKSPHVLHRMYRFGGCPQVDIASVTVGEESLLDRNWDERQHRTAAQVCQDVTLLSSTDHTVVIKFRVDPGGYRLDPLSISLRNITLLEEQQQQQQTKSTGETKDVSSSSSSAPTFVPVKDCQLTVTYPSVEHESKLGYVVVRLVPRHPFELNKMYCVSVNHPEMASFKTDSLMLRNPYYPPSVADRSEGFSTTWRDNLGGSARFVFRETS